MLKRILNFDRYDWNHMRILSLNLIKQSLLLNYHEVIDTYYWIKIHLSYDSKKVN